MVVNGRNSISKLTGSCKGTGSQDKRWTDRKEEATYGDGPKHEETKLPCVLR